MADRQTERNTEPVRRVFVVRLGLPDLGVVAGETLVYAASAPRPLLAVRDVVPSAWGGRGCAFLSGYLEGLCDAGTIEELSNGRLTVHRGSAQPLLRVVK